MVLVGLEKMQPCVGLTNSTAAHHNPIEGFDTYFACTTGLGVVNPAHALIDTDGNKWM